jgi:hypothetical protein
MTSASRLNQGEQNSLLCPQAPLLTWKEWINGISHNRPASSRIAHDRIAGTCLYTLRPALTTVPASPIGVQGGKAKNFASLRILQLNLSVSHFRMWQGFRRRTSS